MSTSPQERLALGVLALLLAGGTLARMAGTPPAAELAAPAAGEAAPLERAAQEASLARLRSLPLRAGERIDVNVASADELVRLPRVGPALAARIVEYREMHGPFRSLPDLDAVSGIGPRMLESIAPHVALPAGVEPPPAGAAATVSAAPQAAARAGPPGGRIDVNRASAQELDSLPGIGAVLARRIVEERELNGPFRGLAELERVRGIGPRLLERLAPHATAGP